MFRWYLWLAMLALRLFIPIIAVLVLWGAFCTMINAPPVFTVIFGAAIGYMMYNR